MAIDDSRFKIDQINWYVAHYTPSIQQYGTLFKQVLSESPTEFRYIEISFFMKQLYIQNLWNFEFGSHDEMNLSIWKIIGFQQRNRPASQNLNIDSFCRLPVTSAQSIIGTMK